MLPFLELSLGVGVISWFGVRVWYGLAVVGMQCLLLLPGSVQRWDFPNFKIPNYYLIPMMEVHRLDHSHNMSDDWQGAHGRNKNLPRLVL